MPNLALTWQQGAGLAVGLAAVAVALRSPAAMRRAVARCSARSPANRPSSPRCTRSGSWPARSRSATAQGAYARARWILRVEHDWHLPSERDVQHWVLPHRWLGEFCNLYYASMHFAALGALLLWVFLRHRDAYPRLRMTVVLLTASCLLIQLIPVAPPRLLPAVRLRRSGRSATASRCTAAPASTSCRPCRPSTSAGPCWSALTAVRVSRSRWRWLVLAHPVITIFVVVATANHFWLDGIVAIALLVLAELAAAAIGPGLPRLRAVRSRERDGRPELVAQLVGTPRLVAMLA